MTSLPPCIYTPLMDAFKHLIGKISPSSMYSWNYFSWLGATPLPPYIYRLLVDAFKHLIGNITPLLCSHSPTNTHSISLSLTHSHTLSLSLSNILSHSLAHAFSLTHLHSYPLHHLSFTLILCNTLTVTLPTQLLSLAYWLTPTHSLTHTNSISLNN
jgi:hypothetical protein